MRSSARLAPLIVLALAACGEAEPPKPAAAPPKPAVLASTPAPTPPPAMQPQPSPDELLRARVEKALRDARDVDGQGVSATAEGGVVSLFGTAPSAAERRAIEQFVGRIDGVKSVVSQIVVVRGS